MKTVKPATPATPNKKPAVKTTEKIETDFPLSEKDEVKKLNINYRRTKKE
ncbi:hypothetical protein HK413_09375 [Mucilaginibacter sp. S1162]|uniref:Uncharacterized protein n=1 Tax=Mucilaginibacter humi TaxID=2732510 RepID=A0ABX1W6Z8_9SPHI|nr:hypothetical protein [Mucilaginibacter humi]NNU34305.1 hypothetical protein [Mucilaginibacter humi]